MNRGSYTIRKTLALHKADSPGSMVSEKMIRDAVRSGELPSIKSGNRSLISWPIFQAWLRGELQHD